MLVLIMIQMELLRYIQFGMLNILLPVGVICRCFGPLRDFGGALMGIAMALFVFYPFVYAVNFAVVLPGQGDTAYLLDEIAVQNELDRVSEGMLIDQMNLQELGHIKARLNPDPGVTDRYERAYGVLSGVSDVWYQITIMLDLVAFGWLSFNASHVIIGVLLLPILNFIIIITAARELSRFLGEEVDVSNLTRMI